MMRLVDADMAQIYLNMEACEQIELMPTVDAVEVVRCKDCKYLSHRHSGMSLEIYEYACSLTNREVSANDFCSYGERKEE